MTLEEFATYHMPALETHEARHNLMLARLGAVAGGATARGAAAPALRFWSMGRAGACAIQTPGWPIVLGDLDEAECARLAEELRALDFPGVVGSGMTANWFADRAAALGVAFGERVPQQILEVRERPRYPGAPGSARAVTADDAALFAEWTLAFIREALPHDPRPKPGVLEKSAASGNHMLWVVDGTPVSIASIGRRTRRGAVINGVYTPPALRGRGYAGSVTAALVEKGYAEGKSFACLYVDRRNPASNRSYAKIGFTPVCEAWHCVRA